MKFIYNGEELSGSSSAKYYAGEGIEITDDTISIRLPTKEVTEAEYNALTEEEKQADVLYLVDTKLPPHTGGSTNNVYSEEEIAVGTWIDGRTIWRKVYVVDMNGLSSIDAGTVDTTWTIINLYGMANNVASKIVLPLNYYNPSNYTHCYINAGVIKLMGNHAALKASTVYVVIEYVKPE